MVNLLTMLGGRLKYVNSQPELSKKILQCSRNPTKYTFPYQKKKLKLVSKKNPEEYSSP